MFAELDVFERLEVCCSFLRDLNLIRDGVGVALDPRKFSAPFGVVSINSFDIFGLKARSLEAFWGQSRMVIVW